MLTSTHVRIRLACLIIIGAVVNLAEPRVASAAATLTCGGFVPYCTSNPAFWCDGCPTNGPTCEVDQGGSGGPYTWFVNCNPI